MGACCRWRERKGDDASQVEVWIVVNKIPGVGQHAVLLNGEYFTIEYAAPVALQFETMSNGGRKVVFHQPFFDQMRHGKRSPDLFRRMGKLTFYDNGAYFMCGYGH